MAQTFKETASIRDNKNDYSKGYEQINWNSKKKKPESLLKVGQRKIDEAGRIFIIEEVKTSTFINHLPTALVRYPNKEGFYFTHEFLLTLEDDSKTYESKPLSEKLITEKPLSEKNRESEKC